MRHRVDNRYWKAPADVAGFVVSQGPQDEVEVLSARSEAGQQS
jgi:hypothetical protein